MAAASDVRRLVEHNAHRFLIDDHDSIYSGSVDRSIAPMGLTILKTPLRSPQANAFCDRVIGTIRRECLDWVMPLNERHVRQVLRQWVAHYNCGRPHTSPGPGIPDAPTSRQCRPVIGFATATASSPNRFSAVFITNTGSNHELREHRGWLA